MPYGLRPVHGSIGLPGPREYPIADGFTTSNIFSGDFVEMLATGFVKRLGDATGASPTGATTLATLGVAWGFRWVDANGVSQFGQYLPANAGNTKTFVTVYDDPNQIFLIQSNGNTTFADVGDNAPVTNFGTANASTATGNSGIALNHGSIAQTALALRILGIRQDGTNEFLTANKDVFVRILPGAHQAALVDQIP